MFSTKIPLVGQIADMIESITNIVYGTSVPEFKISLPSRYGGKDVHIIDFSYFDDYRSLIHSFILYPAWFFFLKGAYKKLPKVIY